MLKNKKTKNEENLNVFYCGICKKPFGTEKGMKIHTTRVHNNKTNDLVTNNDSITNNNKNNVKIKSKINQDLNNGFVFDDSLFNNNDNDLHNDDLNKIIDSLGCWTTDLFDILKLNFNKLNIIELNIYQSLITRFIDIKAILEHKSVDFLRINETKIPKLVPDDH
jgi:hypothetical protein